jgi:acetylxylan esterase
MKRATKAALLCASFGLLAAPGTRAASLQEVSNWGISGLPADVRMFIYVPDNVAANPPVLALIHYCGGTASAVFGQAQGGGLVRAADQHGFIMVVPSSGRCWDVQSNKTWMRDGLGDSHAIAQMVRHTIQTRNANAQRVYATGDSSGGMMTELLLALYPDIFKAGSAMAGMPAGCRGASESGNGGGYSGACAGGSVTHTAQEWGDIARGLHPGYTGHRARVQLFHGDADTIIRIANHTEAVKQWTNVLGLAATPTATSTVTLGTHQATRQSWRNGCGYTVLEAFTSMGGDHGPSDALFLSQYVVPFLGLDTAGAVDPEITQCGTGGSGGGGPGGAGGAGGRGAGGAMGGTSGVGTGGAGQSSGGSATAGSGGAAPGGGAGTPATGGAGNAGNGGGAGIPSGGTLGTGGSATGGSATGGSSGTSTQGGGSGISSGGSSGTGKPPRVDESGGCSVATRSTEPRGAAAFVALGLALAAGVRRRRRGL